MTSPKPRTKKEIPHDKQKDPTLVPSGDPGDDTQRNFRYQHAYTVTLLIGAELGLNAYVSLWCEQHEDILAQKENGQYDAYQIKTSRPENGAWRITDAAMLKSIGRFADLVQQFSARIDRLIFASNTEFDLVGKGVQDQARMARCPKHFLEHVRECVDHAAVAAPFLEVFNVIKAQTGASPENLLSALKLMDLMKGPPREGFDAIVAHEGLAKLPAGATLVRAQLDDWCDALIARVGEICSLKVEDVGKYLCTILSGEIEDAKIKAKKIGLDLISKYAPSSTFTFKGAPELKLGQPRPPSTLEQKLAAGGLEDQVEYLNTRARAAEEHLLEIVAIDAERGKRVIRQVEEMVLGECTEANLAARILGAPFGEKMLNDVQHRLRGVADKKSDMVANKPYECLIGVAGLLTGECRVWWSPRFEIKGGES